MEPLPEQRVFSADSIHFADSLKRTTPGGKVVYGGGGIMPDVFVPADTTDVTKYFVEVAGRNILYRYTIEYADRHREALNAVKTIPELQALLDGDRGLVEDFHPLCGASGRSSALPRHRPFAPTDRGPAQGLTSAAIRHWRTTDLRQYLSRGQRDRTRHRDIGRRIKSD